MNGGGVVGISAGVCEFCLAYVIIALMVRNVVFI